MLKRFKQIVAKYRRAKLLSQLPDSFVNDTLLPIRFISNTHLSDDTLLTNVIINVGPFEPLKDTYYVLTKTYHQKGDV